MKNLIILVILLLSINTYAQVDNIEQYFSYTYHGEIANNGVKKLNKVYFAKALFNDYTLFQEKPVSDDFTYSGKKKTYVCKLGKLYIKDTETSDDDYFLVDINMFVVQYNKLLSRTEYTLFLDSDTSVAQIWSYDNSKKVVLTYVYNGDLKKDEYKTMLRLSNYELENPIMGY